MISETSQKETTHENIPLELNYVIPPFDDEPPLNEDEIRGLEIADREIAEGKAIPFSEVFRDLW